MHIGARWAGRIYRVGMVRRLQAPVVAGAIVLCMLLSVVTAASAAHVRGTRSQASALLGGVNIAGYGSTAAQIDRNIASARNVGAKVVRVEVPWSALEPRAAGVIDPRALAFTDHLTSDAAAAGIKVIMMVESTPCWASSAPASIRARCRPGAAGAASAWPPTNTADYASFVAYLAQRYGPTLAALEVWNEPDQANQHYFAGPDKAARYAALLRAAYPAIKAVDPAVPVLAGSLVGSNGAFLRALYAAGIKGYYNGLSVHFYNLTLASVRSIHEVQLANGDNTPIWLNEFGWSSCWPHYSIQQEQGCVTRSVQAANVTSVIRELARARYVAAAVLYKLQGTNAEDFGLLSASGGHKPAFAAMRSAMLSPLGPTGRISLALRRAHGEVLASGTAPAGDFMRLEVLIGGTLRYWAAFKLDRFNRYSLALPPQLGTSGLTVRVFQYWLGPEVTAQSSI